MKKTALSFITIVFVLWLLPLGVFIKPAQEKTACGGQRAICLCSHRGEAAAKAKPMEASTTYKSAAASQKEAVPAGGAAHYFVAAQTVDAQMLIAAACLEQQYLHYKDPFLSTLDHVPKA